MIPIRIKCKTLHFPRSHATLYTTGWEWFEWYCRSSCLYHSDTLKTDRGQFYQLMRALEVNSSNFELFYPGTVRCLHLQLDGVWSDEEEISQRRRGQSNLWRKDGRFESVENAICFKTLSEWLASEIPTSDTSERNQPIGLGVRISPNMRISCLGLGGCDIHLKPVRVKRTV